ncbi:MAG: Anaerobic nitric oxide reductase transcription regulator NorR [Chlamydiia bacterium]|nr:Anaerobic nitric oxide reductase transcription regulator NorR [Chlamydiia bacterium]
MESILIISCDDSVASELTTYCASHGCTRIDHVDAGTDALEILHVDSYDTIFLNTSLPDYDVIKFLNETLCIYPTARIILIAQADEADTVVKAIKMGATDFLTPNDLTKKLDALFFIKRPSTAQEETIVRSPAMLKLYEEGFKVAGESAPMIVTGEVGVGREHFAKQLFPLASLYVKGHAQFPMLLREPSPEEQRDILKLLSSTKGQVILITSKEPGSLNAELYHRLNVLSFEVLPLRKRKEEIPPLIEHFAQVHANSRARIPIKFTEQAIKKLVEYHWPGNVRELSNFVLRFTLMHTADWVSGDDIHLISTPSSRADPRTLLNKELIQQALEECADDRIRAAQMLNISVEMLQDKIEEFF